MTFFIDAEVLNEGGVTVPSKLITNYVSLLKDEDLEIKLEEGLNLSIKTPLSHTKIKGIDVSEFPLVPQVEGGVSFSLNGSEFMTAINQTGFAASTNVARPVLTGILFVPDKEGVTMVATDSYRLSERHLAAKGIAVESTPFTVPAKIVMELGKILGSTPGVETVEVRVTSNQILFTVGNLHIISRLIEGNFPDYKKIIPASSKTKVLVKLDEFVLAVRKVSLFVHETNNNVKITAMNNGKLVVSTDETQIGEGTTEVEVSLEGENNKIALNAQYLLDVLGHMQCDEITFEIDNKMAPVTIRPVKKEADYTHIIMPLKL